MKLRLNINCTHLFSTINITNVKAMKISEVGATWNAGSKNVGLYWENNIQGVAMKLLGWFYHKHTCTLITYWKGSPSKFCPSAAMHLVQQCCHCWKHLWNSHYGITFSAIITFFLDVYIVLKSLSL